MIRLLLLFPIFALAKPVIEFIPDSRAYGHMLVKNVLEKDYDSLGPVPKLQYRLEEAGFTVRQTFLDDLPRNPDLIRKAYSPGGFREDVKFVICWNHPYFIDMKKFWAIPDYKRIGVFWEPPCIIPDQHKMSVINRYKKALTFRDDMVDNVRLFKFCYPVHQFMNSHLPPYSEKKLACIISGTGTSTDPQELYSLRRRVISFYEKRPYCGFDFYGRGDWSKGNYKNYKGFIPSKADVLKNYKFSYCFENSRDIPGYITEKIFDCFQAGCVPIYFGAQNVTDYIPANCFIDMRQFGGSIEAAHDFISRMSEEEHAHYVENIREYLMSPEAQIFSLEGVYDKLLSILGLS